MRDDIHTEIERTKRRARDGHDQRGTCFLAVCDSPPEKEGDKDLARDWLKGRHVSLTLGRYAPGMGEKECLMRSIGAFPTPAAYILAEYKSMGFSSALRGVLLRDTEILRVYVLSRLDPECAIHASSYHSTRMH
jgi:hypothetical protein